MLEPVAPGVLVHVSEFIQTNTTVVEGPEGVVLVDPGLTRGELECLAGDLAERDAAVVAGFSTHPDWDHVLWHPSLGSVPRYGTAAGAAFMSRFLQEPNWREQVAEGLPPEYAEEIPLELFGLITGLPTGSMTLPWNGPTLRILEHRAHAEGHAALLVEKTGVLVAGDMLSDLLVPFLDLDAEHPIDDYLEALQVFDELAGDVSAFIPGHGSVGDQHELLARIELDRAYVEALRDGETPDDPRIGPSARLEWLADVHEWQRKRLNG